MGDGFHWTCPFCGRDTTIADERRHSDWTDMEIPNAEGGLRLRTLFVVCPNPECKRTALTVSLHSIARDHYNQVKQGERLAMWPLVPASRALALPDYVPRAVVADYEEACLVRDLSPKASATLSRRCLQGIIRDYWQVKPGRLVDEIEQIKDKTDPLTWQAIDSVRKVGNIGAHMEKDIDVIVEVDPNEAELLIGLIESLIRDWYIAREERRLRLERISAVAAQKDEDKKTGKATS